MSVESLAASIDEELCSLDAYSSAFSKRLLRKYIVFRGELSLLVSELTRHFRKAKENFDFFINKIVNAKTATDYSIEVYHTLLTMVVEEMKTITKDVTSVNLMINRIKGFQLTLKNASVNDEVLHEVERLNTVTMSIRAVFVNFDVKLSDALKKLSKSFSDHEIKEAIDILLKEEIFNQDEIRIIDLTEINGKMEEIDRLLGQIFMCIQARQYSKIWPMVDAIILCYHSLLERQGVHNFTTDLCSNCGCKSPAESFCTISTPKQTIVIGNHQFQGAGRCIYCGLSAPVDGLCVFSPKKGTSQSLLLPKSTPFQVINKKPKKGCFSLCFYLFKKKVNPQ